MSEVQEVEITKDPRRWLALMVMLSATLLSVLDFLIVNIALPSIREDMHATDADIQLTVAGYGLAFAVFLITGGRLGDMYGRKRLFQIGMLGFSMASFLCGFAQTPQQLVFFRVIQGLVAALMAPQVLASVQVMFEGRERDTATGLVGATVGVGSFLGNVLGGWLVGANLFELGWRPIFFVNVPIGIIAIILSHFWVKESKSPVAAKLDPLGAVLSSLGLFLLIYPMAEGREKGWPAWAFYMMIVAVGLGWVFVQYERAFAASGGSPLVSMELLKSKGYKRGLLAILLLFSGIASFALVLTLYLQDGLGMKPQPVGVVFASLSIAFFISSLSAAKIVQRLGQKSLLIGLWMMKIALCALLVLPLVYGERLNPFALMPILFFYGLGQGFCVPQVIRRTLNEVGTHHAGAAVGLLNTIQQVGFTLGVSVVGAVFFAFVENKTITTVVGHSRGLAAAFACNIILLLLTRLLLQRNFRKEEASGQAHQPHVAFVEI